jgi:hypothetical protein
MAAILTLPHALIMAAISAVFFSGGFVFMSRNTSSSVKELQASVKENNAITNQKLDSVVLSLHTMQIESNRQSDVSKREIDLLVYRVTALENKDKNNVSIN